MTFRRNRTAEEIADVEAYARAHPDEALAARRRASHMKHIAKEYGMTLGDYKALVEVQDGRCAVCGERPARLVVDHCHQTDRVRGLLCGRCNTALGLLRERLTAARGMVAYIADRCDVAKSAGPMVPASGLRITK